LEGCNIQIYYELIENNKILQLLGDNYKRILIIGCGGCVNESLALKNKIPIIVLDEITRQSIPYSVTNEIKRLAKLLHKHVFDVIWKVVPENNLLCMRNVNEDIPVTINETTIDAILAICCPAGIYGLRKIVSNSIHIFQITKQIGFLYYVFDEYENEKKIKYEDSKVIIYQGNVYEKLNVDKEKGGTENEGY